MELDGSDISSDKLFQDPRFDDITQKIIEKQIELGNTPSGAAAEANIPKAVFNRWMETEEFSNWIGGLTDKHIGALHLIIENAIDEIEKPKDQADIAIKHLERISPSYGTKHIDVTEKKGNLERPDYDPEFKQMLQEAEKEANGNDGI